MDVNHDSVGGASLLRTEVLLVQGAGFINAVVEIVAFFLAEIFALTGAITAVRTRCIGATAHPFDALQIAARGILAGTIGIRHARDTEGLLPAASRSGRRVIRRFLVAFALFKRTREDGEVLVAAPISVGAILGFLHASAGREPRVFVAMFAVANGFADGGSAGASRNGDSTKDERKSQEESSNHRRRSLSSEVEATTVGSGLDFAFISVSRVDAITRSNALPIGAAFVI